MILFAQKNSEFGRSLIEIIGVLAIAGVMTAGAIASYSGLRRSQARTIASAQLQEIARDIKILMEMRGTYDGVSVGYLIKAGALQNDNAPLGGAGWSVEPTYDGTGFSINLVDLSQGDCDYFASAKPTWATSVLINGQSVINDNTDPCFKSDINKVSFVVE